MLNLHTPAAIVAALRSPAPPDDAGILVAQLDHRIAGIALCALRDEVDGDYDRADRQRERDNLARILLMLRCGIFDHAIRTECGRPVFAVSDAARPAIERVAAARLAELGVPG